MSNQTYDRIKFCALLIAPIVAFIASLVSIWGIPYGEQIVATLTALDTLIGAVVVVASKRYNGGD